MADNEWIASLRYGECHIFEIVRELPKMFELPPGRTFKVRRIMKPRLFARFDNKGGAEKFREDYQAQTAAIDRQIKENDETRARLNGAQRDIRTWLFTEANKS